MLSWEWVVAVVALVVALTAAIFFGFKKANED